MRQTLHHRKLWGNRNQDKLCALPRAATGTGNQLDRNLPGLCSSAASALFGPLNFGIEVYSDSGSSKMGMMERWATRGATLPRQNASVPALR
jgi:hypothetical protein